MAVVCGRLQMREWTDREGNKRISAEIVADGVYFGDSQTKANGNPGSDNASAFDPDAGGAPPDGFVPEFGDTDGELPF